MAAIASHGQIQVLRRLDAGFQTGRITALVGPNCCGLPGETVKRSRPLIVVFAVNLSAMSIIAIGPLDVPWHHSATSCRFRLAGCQWSTSHAFRPDRRHTRGKRQRAFAR